MIDRKLKDAVIIKEARQLLKQGISRQETFEILYQKYKNSNRIFDVIKNLPSSKSIKIYGKWNYTLLALLILSTYFFLLSYLSLGSFVLFGVSVFVVAKMLVKYYVWVTILAAFGIICLMAMITMYGTKTINLIILFIILIGYIVFPLWIKSKLCPKPNVRKELYTDSQGQQRLRIVYEFKD